MKRNRRFILKEEFISDFAEAMNWYGERSQESATDLFSDVQTILRHIENHPESFSAIQRNYRQAVLGNFPYVIVYKIYRAEISVYAFFHTSRNPRKKIRRK